METQKSGSRKAVIFLSIVTVFLAVALGFLVYEFNKMKADNKVAQEAIEMQKESLAKDLNNLIGEYDGLKSDNDSMNVKIEAQQDHIKKLLSMNASNLEKIRIYKNELATMRTILKSYIVQIDSLNQRNQLLVAENGEVKSKLEDARKSNESLSAEKETLTSKVKSAAVLSAKNVMVTALNKRGKDTEKASKTTKLKVCCTIRENSVAEAGTRTIYLRIARPDGLIITSSEGNVIKIDGTDIIYSSRRDIEYENKDVDMCIFTDGNTELIAGNYTIDLFAEGKLIGSSTFALK
jgi:FtsZ-binding cell division protein ZapB